MPLEPSDLPPSDGGGTVDQEEAADRALVELFQGHYATLVRVAYLLVGDADRAEELVQDAFVDLHHRWFRLADEAAATEHLRRSVVHRSRIALRHLERVRAREVRTLLRDVVSTGPSAPEVGNSKQVLAWLHRLPQRQREVLVLRCYGRLSNADVAAAVGIRLGAVATYGTRGLDALRPVLGGTP